MFSTDVSVFLQQMHDINEPTTDVENKREHNTHNDLCCGKYI